MTPYETWVSEIMCQQTRVETVIPYFQRWMEHFPSVEALASATESDVNKLWAGLGYYRRARLLHSGAKHVCEHNDGNLPEDREGLLKIPGIGAYTAGAIASIAFGRREPLVDGNVIRVFRGTGRSQERRRVPSSCSTAGNWRRPWSSGPHALETSIRP